MARSRVGLDVGSTAVRAAEVAVGEPMTVVRAAQVPLQRGAVELGEVRQPEVVGQAIRELWQRGGFKARQVVMGVGNQRCVVREVGIPWLPEKELRASLGFQVQEYIPMSVDEAVLDYDLLGEFEQEGRKMLRLLLVAAQRVMVNNLVAAAQAGKVEPVGIDLIPFALVRSVGSDEPGMDLEGGEEAVIDVGAHVTNICVHDHQATRFVRILPSGGRDVTLAIARSLGLEEDVAERLKRGEQVEGAPSVEEALRVATARAGSFVDEIRSSLEFYTAQVQGARIGRVLVTGGGSKLQGFLELLRDRIPVPVERGRPLAKVRSRLSLSEEAAAEAEPVLAAAIGLAIPGRSS